MAAGQHRQRHAIPSGARREKNSGGGILTRDQRGRYHGWSRSQIKESRIREVDSRWMGIISRCAAKLGGRGRAVWQLAEADEDGSLTAHKAVMGEKGGDESTKGGVGGDGGDGR
ncbi:hypothetical protein N7532_005868 [Penicillium argentinense]|uniref:Uncharacterized protein n=1 Tax=Penicillium argentinense TaxID=1131581 RepID=A0A9W9KBE5_9EURO|nr:uncharacterized protein N7532_005868 [Penicillium argentinense]KAJ5098867.1 hypothetical protein N7532_005868 [Penicillium argentinense]